MPIEVHYDPGSNTLFGRVIGDPAPDEIIASFELVRAAGTIPVDADIIWDMRAMDFTALSIERLRDIVKRRKKLNTYRADCASAYVVLGPQEERMIRLMIAVSVGVQRREAIFRSMDKAKSWLRGLKTPQTTVTAPIGGGTTPPP
ncbi:hypothetical protein EOI86_21255 [Hwanghaeella grinnelliae]|uniref:STAS/SEC14 domain-containing protein n=1 Tax=Hwanghaeella grinnelliae TaxID=2500179 RepID=A0A437QGK6_9PROT|nr:hypothetical protein [Hwanghaeella grinnelliae]RVU33683.1 hypothetical protein EOI86_21255 [Hwanghaeella grinnelliae]